MKQTTVKVERGSRGFGLSLVYRGLDHFAQVGWLAIFLFSIQCFQIFLHKISIISMNHFAQVGPQDISQT